MPAEFPSFALEVRAEAGRTLFVPRGELDLATAPELEDRVLAALRGAEHPVVLDLRELTFMDSTGIRTIIAAHHVAQDAGADLRLIGPHPDTVVWRVIEISGIAQSLGLVDGL